MERCIAYPLAKAIVAARSHRPIQTTVQLKKLAETFVPPHRSAKFLAKAFQAFRIEDELGTLKDMVSVCWNGEVGFVGLTFCSLWGLIFWIVDKNFGHKQYGWTVADWLLLQWGFVSKNAHSKSCILQILRKPPKANVPKRRQLRREITKHFSCVGSRFAP